MTLRVVLLLFCVSAVRGREHENSVSAVISITPDYTDDNSTITTEAPLGCVCGIYLFEAKKLTKELPEGDPVISHNISEKFPNNPDGHKSCTKKCLSIVSREFDYLKKLTIRFVFIIFY